MLPSRFSILLLAIIPITGISAQTAPSPLKGKKICIDPGHGGTAATDSYRVGSAGEREEWINLRVALLLKRMLEKKGATVIMTRTEDVKVDLSPRAALARASHADVFISIHHNATADRNVNFPIIYFHGASSENKAGVQLGRHLANALLEVFHTKSRIVSLVSDYTIFPDAGAAVLRETYGIPALLAEASFFTNAAEERRLKTRKHNHNEATAYMIALEKFFSEQPAEIKPKFIPDHLPPFAVLQEADRMKPEALRWLEDFEEAKKLSAQKDSVSQQKAYTLFSRSARSFPDSWVAADCHYFRAEILSGMNRITEAGEERTRAKEFYVRQ